jgi:ribosomal-protein-alanine N-acetyltransferase
MYEDELRDTATCFVVVLRTASTRVAGYCSYRLVVDELQINNVAVRPEHRGMGYGRALVSAALAHGGAAGAGLALLEVRRSNAAARQLYLSLGFEQIGERSRYYSHPEEDALILARRVRILGQDPAS